MPCSFAGVVVDVVDHEQLVSPGGQRLGRGGDQLGTLQQQERLHGVDGAGGNEDLTTFAVLRARLDTELYRLSRAPSAHAEFG
jgi:hypothetical protein